MLHFNLNPNPERQYSFLAEALIDSFFNKVSTSFQKYISLTPSSSEEISSPLSTDLSYKIKIVQEIYKNPTNYLVPTSKVDEFQKIFTGCVENKQPQENSLPPSSEPSIEDSYEHLSLLLFQDPSIVQMVVTAIPRTLPYEDKVHWAIQLHTQLYDLPKEEKEIFLKAFQELSPEERKEELNYQKLLFQEFQNVPPEAQNECMELLTLINKHRSHKEKAVDASLFFLSLLIVQMFSKSLPTIKYADINVYEKEDIYNFSHINSLIFRLQIANQNELIGACLSEITKYLHPLERSSLDHTILQELFKIISSKILNMGQEYPNFQINSFTGLDFYSEKPNREELANNVSQQAISAILEEIHNSKESNDLDILFHKLVLIGGNFRSKLAEIQESKDPHLFGKIRSGGLTTPFGLDNRYNEYTNAFFFRKEAKLTTSIASSNQEGITEYIDPPEMGFSYSLEFCSVESLSNHPSPKYAQVKKGISKELPPPLKYKEILMEYLEKDEIKISLSFYAICGKTDFDLFHLLLVSATQLDKWLQETLLDCLTPYSNETELKKRIGLFRYLFAQRTPYSRGSAMIGEWFEKALYKFHCYDFVYKYDEVISNGGLPLGDLDAFASLGLTQFLKNYCRKAHLTIPPPKPILKKQKKP